MRSRLTALGVLAGAILAAAPVGAQVSWTDWTSNGPGVVSGTVDFLGTPVGVTYSGAYSGVQLGCGVNYWSPNTYTGPGVPNAPGNCEIIQLTNGGLKTITFSQAVTNPLIALVSWNLQPSVPFSGPLELVSSGCGFFGCGTISVAGSTATMSGEAHGTIRLLGTYTSFTFTDASEGWHGITIGAESLAVGVVPEPSTYVLMATGLLGVAAAARRRRGS